MGPKGIYKYIFNSEFSSEALEKSTHEMLKLAKKECKKRNNTDKIEPKDLQVARRLTDDCNF